MQVPLPFLTSPTVLITQLLGAFCTFMQCERNYPSPVSLLPQGYRADTSADFSPSYIVVSKNNVTLGTRRGRLANNEYGDDEEARINEVSSSYSSSWEEEVKEDNASLLSPLVYTKLGSVEGYYMTVISGRQIYAFEGIPYALPPLGVRRFQTPSKHPGWLDNEPLEAKNPGPPCIQFNGPEGGIIGSEDCLRMNVYTPKIPQKDVKSTKLLPVIIFIHGGLFMAGSGSRYGPAYLLEKDIILVTFNYRLGILGSFSTGDEIAPGNWGMKDQALLINFVYENIQTFGGDPNRIVLMGQSAGAVSTHLHLLSPLARDKISGAIMISGNAYNFWGLNTLEQGVRLSKSIARFSLCSPTQGSKDLVDCMRTVSAGVLIANQFFTLGSLTFTAPMIEPLLPGAFIIESPDESYAKGKVPPIPAIMTITSKEANTLMVELIARGSMSWLERAFDYDAPLLLGLRGRIPSEKESSIISKIRKQYNLPDLPTLSPLSLPIPISISIAFPFLNSKSTSSSSGGRQTLTDIGNARYFTVPFHKGVQMQSQVGPTYAGIFSYSDHLGKPGRLGLKNYKEYGVTHNDDLVYVFNKTSFPPIARGDGAFAVTKLLRNIYLNFGQSKVPFYTLEDDKNMKRKWPKYKFWEPVSDPTDMKFLQIDQEVKMIDDPYKEMVEFWESLEIPDMKSFTRIDSNATEVSSTPNPSQSL